jgi:uncharacterized protein (DUF1786 family)
MSICPECGKKVRGADKVRIKGIWRHHHTSIKKPEKIKTEQMKMKNKNLTDEQMIKGMVDKFMKGVN